MGLLPGQLSPTLQAQEVRLATEIPSFERAARTFASFTGVHPSEASTRRTTEAMGAVEVRRVAVLATTPQAVTGEREAGEAGEAGEAPPERVSVFVDGAMVPLVQGEWAEVKTLAIGVPEPCPRVTKGRAHQEVECVELSYFSRLANWERFCTEGVGEIRRRGVPQAGAVSFGSDGAAWCGHCADAWCPEAVRFLDFPHAAEYVTAAAAVYYRELPVTREQWVEEQLHALKHEGPQGTVAALRRWEQVLTAPADQAVVRKSADYLEPRMEAMNYPELRAGGWPIGTGSVESANKLVVEARLKGPGMHWARPHVDPMLALRNMVCSERWDTDWPVLAAARRAERYQREDERGRMTRKLRSGAAAPPAAALREGISLREPPLAYAKS